MLVWVPLLGFVGGRWWLVRGSWGREGFGGRESEITDKSRANEIERERERERRRKKERERESRGGERTDT